MNLVVGKTFLYIFLKKFGGMKKGCNFAVRKTNKVPGWGNEEMFFERLK
jgi:hypothetical protein